MENRENAMEKQKKEYEAEKMSEVQVAQMKQKIEQAKRENRQEQKRRTGKQVSMAAAAVLAVMFLLPNASAQVAHAMEQVPFLAKWVDVVTFRDYQYEDERNSADIQVPQLVVREESRTEEAEDTDDKEAETMQQIQLTTEEINAKIDKITQQMIAEFEEGLKAEEGYQSMTVTSEVIATTDTYFTLKLNCYQGAGSGAEWNYYYTIDLRSGEQITLADLFEEGTDYITPISENIKEQMREQMAADDMVSYWLDDPEVAEWNFQQITDDTGFYLNEAGEVVIAFNEGDVAPMYMGCVQFTIPNEVLENIRK